MRFWPRAKEWGRGADDPTGLFVALAKDVKRAAVRVDVAVDGTPIRLKEKKNARARARSEQTLHISRDRVKKPI